MALPYAPHTNPADNTPRIVSGSNATVKSDGSLARRPGFSTHTADDFGSGNTIERFHHWRAWDGSHYIFANVLISGSSRVYKQKVGTDATFQSLFTSDAAEPFDFEVANNAVFYGNGTDMRKYDGTNEQKWGITAPTVTPVATNSASGSVPAAIGHRYRYAFENSATGHLSDLSPSSDEITTASRQWQITGSGSSDAQVDQIRIFRTEDGGSVYYELSESPIADPGAATWTLDDDNDTDAQLKSTQAPIVTVNAEPTAGTGVEFFAGRLWWFNNDTLYFTGFEEVNNGRNVESAPSDNKFEFGQEITGLASSSGLLFLATRNSIWTISGDSISTFRRQLLGKGMGCHNRACFISAGDFVAWLDVGNVVRVSNGEEVREISLPIRTDIESINHANAHMSFWDDGIRHFLILMDGGANALRVYDFDLDIWNVPWSITTPTAIGVGQTADGTHRLFLGRTSGTTNKPLRMNTSTFSDDSTAYTANIITNLMDIAPKENPMMRGNIEHVILERNVASISDISLIYDEEPKSGTFTALTRKTNDPHGRTPGQTLVEEWFDDREAGGRRAAARLRWAASDSEFQVHALTVGYRIRER